MSGTTAARRAATSPSHLLLVTAVALGLAGCDPGEKPTGDETGADSGTDTGADTFAETGADSPGDSADTGGEDSDTAPAPGLWDACAGFANDVDDFMGYHVARTGDVDGDGLADFAVSGAFRGSTIEVGLGPFVAPPADWSAASWSDPAYGYSGNLVSDFDWNADGATDLLSFGSYEGSSSVILLDGPATDPHVVDPTRDMVFTGAWGDEHEWMQGADDAWVLVERVTDGVHRVDGHAVGLPGVYGTDDATWAVTNSWPGVETQSGGTSADLASIRDVGDLDGDGAGELVVTTATYVLEFVGGEKGTYRSAVFLFRGPIVGSITEADADLVSAEAWSYDAVEVAPAPDADGDGAAELFLTVGPSGEVFRFDGLPAALSPAAVTGTADCDCGPSTTIDARGDVDGDGGPDLVVAGSHGLLVFDAAIEGTVDASAARAQIDVELGRAEFASIQSLGDADGDGGDDLILGLPVGLDGESEAAVCLLRATAILGAAGP